MKKGVTIEVLIKTEEGKTYGLGFSRDEFAAAGMSVADGLNHLITCVYQTLTRIDKEK